MRALLKHRPTRLLAASAVALATVGAATCTAQAAVAPRPQIQTGCIPYESLQGNSSEVVAYDEWVCTEPSGTRIVDFPVTLSRLVNGTWVTLVSGEGVVVHYCVGTTTYEYTADGITGTYACG